MLFQQSQQKLQIKSYTLPVKFTLDVLIKKKIIQAKLNYEIGAHLQHKRIKKNSNKPRKFRYKIANILILETNEH